MYLLVEKINYHDDKLSLIFENSLEGSIVIRDRQTDEIVLECEIKGNDILLNLNELKLYENGKYFYDIYFRSGSNQRRIRMFERNNLSEDLRFPFKYNTLSLIDALPYISKDGYICIMQNSVINLHRQGKLNVRNTLEKNYVLVSFQADNLIITDINHDKILYLKNRETKEIIIIDKLNFREFFNENTPNISAGHYEILLFVFDSTTFFDIPLRIENEYNDKKISIFEFENKGKVHKICIEKEGVLNLQVKDTLTNYFENGNVVFQKECLYESFSINQDKLFLYFRNIECLENDTEFWLYNKQGSYKINGHFVDNIKFEFSMESELIEYVQNVETAELVKLEKNDFEFIKTNVKPVSNFYKNGTKLIGHDIYMNLSAEKIEFKHIIEEQNDNSCECVIEKNISVTNMDFKENCIQFEIESSNDYETINFYYRDRATKEESPVNVHMENGIFKLDIRTFIETLTFEKCRADLFVSMVSERLNLRGKIQLVSSRVKDKSKRYFYNIECPADIRGLSNRNNVLMFFLTVNNELSFVVRDKKFIYSEKYELNSKLLECSLGSDGLLNIKSNLTTKSSSDISNIQTVLILKSKIKDVCIIMKEIETNYSDEGIIQQSVLNMNKLDLEQFYYEVYIQAEIDDELIYSRVGNPESSLKDILNYQIGKNTLKIDNDLIYPFITNRNVLYIAYRENISEDFPKWMNNEVRAEKFYKRFKYQLDAQKIWLVYEKESETAQDNSFYFFKYCYENHKSRNIYYIIKKNSPDKNQLKGMEDRVVEFMSFKHLVLLQAAQLLVASETRGHAYIWRYQKGKIREILDKKPFVFLQHGVTAFKLNDSVLRKDSPTSVNLYVTTSEFEREVIKNGLGYNHSDVMVTGFPRWDYLNDLSKETEKRKVLVMPTWRSWLDEVSETEFLSNEYYLNYIELLQSEDLSKIAVEHNLEINFLLHPKFKQYISSFDVDSEHVRLISFGDKKINEVLMESSLLITDYSSVAWEMYYMNKPTIFYQFDYSKYIELTGSYIDMNETIFGERAFDVSSVLQTLKDYAENDFEEKESFKNMRSHFFEFEDKNNSDRVYNGIISSKYFKKLNKKKYNNTPIPNRIKLLILKFKKIL